jgi:hypothetical protein
MTIPIAPQEEVANFTHEFSGWSIENGKLHREFIFANFC